MVSEIKRKQIFTATFNRNYNTLDSRYVGIVRSQKNDLIADLIVRRLNFNELCYDSKLLDKKIRERNAVYLVIV